MFGWLRRPPRASLGLEISAAELRTALDAPSPPFLLDVRGAGEFAAGHLAGATLIPLPHLPAHLQEIPAGRAVVCICLSGHRSAMAARLLRARGYSAQSLARGMAGWPAAI